MAIPKFPGYESSTSTSSSMNVQDILSQNNTAEPASTIVCPPSPALSSTESTTSSSDSDADPLKRGWVAPFLLHLHQMLRRENPKIIRWSADGIAFEILDKEALTNQVLPRYFKNKNFASFQRQLNYFGFRKWSKARSQFPTYSREHFTRDNYNEMSLVKRQSKKSRKRAATSSSDEQELKRPTLQGYWIASEKCKPILPKPEASPERVSSPAPVVTPVEAQVGVTMESPSQSPMPQMLEAPALDLFVRAATTTSSSSLFNIPVISPTRKVTSGFKLPSIRELTCASALAPCDVNVRPQWLA